MNAFRKTGGGRPPNRRGFSDAASARPSFGRSGGAGARGASARPAGRGGKSYGADRREAVQKFDAICSSCGKACQVPFRPNGKLPVYCKECFDSPRKPGMGAGAGKPTGKIFSTNDSASGGGKTIADLTRQIAAMNTKIDTMLEILQDSGNE